MGVRFTSYRISQPSVPRGDECHCGGDHMWRIQRRGASVWAGGSLGAAVHHDICVAKHWVCGQLFSMGFWLRWIRTALWPAGDELLPPEGKHPGSLRERCPLGGWRCSCESPALLSAWVIRNDRLGNVGIKLTCELCQKPQPNQNQSTSAGFGSCFFSFCFVGFFTLNRNLFRSTSF